MKNILFIRGFNTEIKSNEEDHYQHFETFFSLSEKYTLKYFNYSTKENIEDVYINCSNLIKNNTYSILIGHSLGGGILYRFCNENLKYCKKQFQQILFLMPLISKDNTLVRMISKIYGIGNIPLLKAIMIPNNDLYNNGNFLNDSYTFIRMKQIQDVYNNWNIFDNIHKVLNNLPNSMVIYAKNEKLNIINKKTLDLIKNKIIFQGKHELFNDFIGEKVFFQYLKTIFF